MTSYLDLHTNMTPPNIVDINTHISARLLLETTFEWRRDILPVLMCSRLKNKTKKTKNE